AAHAGAAATAAALTAAEHLEVLADDLGLVLLLAAVLVVPRARLDAPLDEDLLALGEVLAGDLGLLAVADDVVPLGLLLALTVAVLEPPAGGDAEVGHRLAGGQRADLGVAAQVADEDHLVHHVGVRPPLGRLLRACRGGRICSARGLGTYHDDLLLAGRREPSRTHYERIPCGWSCSASRVPASPSAVRRSAPSGGASSPSSASRRATASSRRRRRRASSPACASSRT